MPAFISFLWVEDQGYVFSSHEAIPLYLSNQNFDSTENARLLLFIHHFHTLSSIYRDSK